MNHKPPHAIFFNPTPEMVKTFALAHPRRFVFTFVTGPVDSVPDFRGLPKSEYVAQPIWAGERLTADAETSLRNYVASLFEAAQSKIEPWHASFKWRDDEQTKN